MIKRGCNLSLQDEQLVRNVRLSPAASRIEILWRFNEFGLFDQTGFLLSQPGATQLVGMRGAQVPGVLMLAIRIKPRIF
jgi:hypothetical protein